MALHKINDHNVEVPDDMIVHLESGFPGAFDWIEYKGYSIHTYDADEDESAPYVDGFSIMTNDGNADLIDDECATLDDCRRVIDAQIGMINAKVR